MVTNTLHRRSLTEKAQQLTNAGLTQCVHSNCKMACAAAGAVIPAKGKVPATVRCARRNGQPITAAEIGPTCKLITMPGNVEPDPGVVSRDSKRLGPEVPEAVPITIPLVA